ncbi:MAG: DEAD/DEAH box helicase [Caldilineaceae bacterium]|nr:DEAD/DEAH box helicase [Caldilineaceae bacterium]
MARSETGSIAPGTAPNRQRLRKTPSHPGQLPVNQLRTLVAEELPRLLVHEMQPANATVWLPSHNGVPLARRSVLHKETPSREQDNGTLSLDNWQVTGLVLPPLEALIFLCQTRMQRHSHMPVPAEGITQLRLGNDLLYWSNAAKYALEMLIGQHYVPALRRNGATGLYALWQPTLLDDRLRRRLQGMVETMPPVCRAYNLERTSVAPAPAELTEHFVATLVDAAVRAWSNGDRGVAAHTPALQWVSQLRSESRLLSLPPQPAYRFAQEWQSWIEQLHVTSDANFRITLELVEPDQPAGSAGYGGALENGQEELPPERTHWTLRYYLQARDDPRLLISAEQVWMAHNGLLRFGNRRVDRPQERLLAGLGAASRLFPPIERSLRSPRPERAILTPVEAHRFLREVAPLLESNGFGVILPEWWNARQRTRLGLRLRLFSDENALWNGDDEPGDKPPTRRRAGPIHYAWELTLGNDRVSQEDFEALAAHNVPLLKLHDSWIELDPTQVAAAKRFLSDRKASGEMSLLQSIRMAQAYLQQTVDSQPSADGDGAGPVLLPATIEVDVAPDTLPLEAVDVDGWLRTVLDQLRSQKVVAELGEPQGFVGELRPYQRRGLGWLVYLRRLGLGACLADDMGLGKTVQAIAMLLHARVENAGQNGHNLPTLLVCPTSVVANWRREVERFAPSLRVLVHHGGSRLEGDDFLHALKSHDLVITSYGTARRDIDVLLKCEWSDLILDEAQNIKNPGAKQSQAVRRLVARNRVALTGTPVENHLTELWSVLEFLNPGYLGGHERFRQQFTVPIERYNDDERAAELRRLVQPFLLRRLKSDPTIISDLPEKNEMIVYCSLTKEQATLYETTVQESLATLDRADGIQRRGLVLSLLTRLKQICNHPAQYLKQSGPLRLRSGKLERLTEMLEEALSVGDHALIFTQFVEMGTLLQNYLRTRLQTEALFLHGGTPAAQRDQMVQAFQSEDGPAIFVLSLRAGGSGLNLTRANHVFHFDRWWNPAVENQATDRAFRIGQRRNVQVHKFVVAGTLEERISNIIENKQALAESIVGSGENWLTELDTEQLRELLTLRQEMLDE